MLIFIVILIIVIYFVQDWSKKNALKGITYEYRFSKKLVEPDEPLQLISTITNESRHFVPFIRMEESLPRGLEALSKKVYIREDMLGQLKYNSSIYLMARSRLNRKLMIKFAKRGCYQFHGADFLGGDFLGLIEKRRHFQQFREVVVYPKATEAPKLNEVMGAFLGDISVRRFIMEDPILTVGARAYTGREPLNQLSWKHTARTNQMMVKQFDYTTEMLVTVLLDISPVVGETIHEFECENCFSLTRGVCQYLEKKNIEFEFISNSRLDGAALDLQRLSRTGMGKSHLHLILEKLGRATYATFETFDEMVETLASKQHQNRSTIIVTPKRDVQKEQVAKKLAQDGTSQLIFIYGSDYDDLYSRTETHL